MIKNNFLFFAAISIVLMLNSCAPSIYTASNFDAVARKQEMLAILPFKASLEIKKLPKGMTEESIRESNKNTGYSVQSNLYSVFLKQFSKNKYTIDFQDIDRTNAILKKNNIEYSDLIVMDKAEICKLLEVDGVISGDVRMTKPMSETGAVVMAVLVGAWGTTNRTDVSLTIHNKEDAKLLWKYDYSASGSLGSSVESLTKGLMKNVSKKFPYKRK